MAKLIKFNLLLDEKPVRDIDGLRNNFNIHELLDYYESGVLERWLHARGYNDILIKVQGIENNSEENVLKGLINAFEIDINQDSLREAIYSLQQIKRRKEQIERFRKDEFKIARIIEDYHLEFYQVLQEIETRNNDFPFIQAKIGLLSGRFRELIKINTERFYSYFIEHAPLVIFAVLMDRQLRQNFLDDSSLFPKLKEIVAPEYLEKLPFNFMWSNAAHEQKYWRVIGKKDHEYLILRMEDGNYVRNLEKFDEALTFKDVNGKFPILRGIEYQSAYPEHKILFLPCSARDPFWATAFQKTSSN